MDEMNTKIDRIKIPRNISCRPILIHVNGVADAVNESRYFSEIIDFGKLLDVS